MGVCLSVPHRTMLLFKSPSLAFLVLAKILCVLNKFHFNFFKIKKLLFHIINKFSL